jgi:hypothetical protein
MNNRTFAYVCAPYNAAREFPSEKTKEYCRTLLELGYLPVAPNMMFSQFMKDTVPQEREARRGMAQSLLRRCRVLVVCSDEITEEMETEIMLAKRLGMVSTTLAGIRKISLHGKVNAGEN